MAAEILQEEDDWDDTWEDDSVWSPEEEVSEDPSFIRSRVALLPKVAHLRPSDFTAHAFWLPRPEKYLDEDGFEAERVVNDKFSFEGRRHMYRCYDTPSKRLLLCCARQTEKSTLIGNTLLTYMCLVRDYKALYVSPSMTQTKTFSMDRIKTPLETSPILRKFTTSMLSQNILEKQLVNRSKLTLRYAYLNADRCRGIPAYALAIDEFQNVLSDNIPIIEQCLSHAPKSLKRQIYAGTPLSLDNHLEFYRANRSTQGEWVVPCEACNHWNILGERNIGKRWLCCEKCKKQIYPAHPRAQWANMVKEAPWESYRFNQLMVPWVDWKKDIVEAYEMYAREKFYNEVLGLSIDSGYRPLTTQQMKDVCKSHISMRDVEKYAELSQSQHIYCGLDWGSAENSYTVLTLGTYVDMKFRIFYAHRFIGAEADPEIQMQMIEEVIKHFNIRFIGSDYGGGFNPNYKLVKTFGVQRLRKFQYLARSNAGKIAFDPKLQRYKVLRTEVLSDFFNAIKRGKLEFPNWEEWKEPYGQDFLNIYSEFNEKLHAIQYKHGVDKPDDTAHSSLYCLLASCFDYPRPDIFRPDVENVHGLRQKVWPSPGGQG